MKFSIVLIETNCIPEKVTVLGWFDTKEEAMTVFQDEKNHLELGDILQITEVIAEKK